MMKVSFHPGQFTVLASETPDIVDRSIDEFEYHVNMARWMGFGKSFQDGCKINVHISGRQGPQGIIKALPRLSPEARNLITIENDEMGWGLESSLELEKHCALVLDIHHHWVRTGEYLQANDDRVKRVVDSWRGVRSIPIILSQEMNGLLLLIQMEIYMKVFTICKHFWIKVARNKNLEHTANYFQIVL